MVNSGRPACAVSLSVSAVIVPDGLRVVLVIFLLVASHIIIILLLGLLFIRLLGLLLVVGLVIGSVLEV